MMRHYVSALPDVALCGLSLKPAEHEEFDPSGSVCGLCVSVAERLRKSPRVVAVDPASRSAGTAVATLRDGMIVGEVHYADARVIASPGGNALRCGAQITEPSTDRLEAVTCEGCRRAIVLVVGADGASGPMTAWAASCLNLPMRGPFPSDVPTSQLVNAVGLSPDHARAVRAEHRVAELEAALEKSARELVESRQVLELQKMEGERLREGWDRQVNELGRQLNDGRRTIEKLCAERDSAEQRLVQSQKDYAKALEERDGYKAMNGKHFGDVLAADIEQARAVAAAVEAEREACAKVAETHQVDLQVMQMIGPTGLRHVLARVIRERGKR